MNYFNSIVLKTNKEKYFSFSFIRNPFDRLYSTYMFLSKGGMNNHDRLAFDNHLSKFKDFEDFVLNGLDRKIIYKIIHLIPQHQYLCDKKDRLIGFKEKPVEKFTVSMGIYMLNREVLNFIPKKFFGFDDLMLKLIKQGIKVCVKPHLGNWLDIGRPEDYMKAIEVFDPKVYL